MSNDINIITLVGRLTGDPRIKQTTAGNIAEFSLANSRKYGNKEQTLFIDCKAWKGLADVVGQFCFKGKQVGVQGRLQMDRWTAPDGQNRQKIYMLVESLQLLGDGRAAQQSKPSGPASYANFDNPAPTQPNDAYMPF